MKRMLKILFKTLLTIIFLFVIYVFGLFAQLPIIPLIETDYFVVGTNQLLANGYIIKKSENLTMKFEVPNEFSENEQCFDFWFLSVKGQHMLTIKDFSQTVFDNDKTKIKSQNSYLFWEDGSQEDKFKIENYEIAYSDNYDKMKYVFFRTVFDVDNNSEFSIKIKIDLEIDNIPSLIDTTLQIEKKHRLSWNKFRVH